MKWGTSGLVSNQILLVSICEGSYANQSAGRGGLLALRRILKCQPFHKQETIEYDPVP